MDTSCHPETKALLIKLFAQSNPIYTINQIIANPNLYQSSKEYLFPPTDFTSCKLYIYSKKIFSACERLGIKHKIKFESVLHIFPVVQEIVNEGFMVPLNITPSDDWHISDAFGTFGISSNKTPYEIFNNFLEAIEEKWLQTNPGNPLPLRWRKTFSLSIQDFLHFNAIGGKSLQVPLTVAVLRTFAQRQGTSSKNSCLPFGNAPVFSSGVLNLPSGQFEPIDGLDIKLEAFIREYGKGLTAILTTNQIMQLEKDFPNLLEQINLVQADNLTDLLALKELYDGLIKFCSPPQATEIDALLELMFKIKTKVRFKEMEEIIKWLRPNISSPVYTFQLERNLGQTEAHKGKFTKAVEYLKNATKILSQNPSYFGISEKIDLATAWGTAAVDTCDEKIAMSLLKNIKADIDHADASKRAKYWGTLCQIYRVTEAYDQSIAAGEKSIFFADFALASEAGRNRNYLIHALIARARNAPETLDADLARAKILLHEARNEWAPIHQENVHFGFCLHFEAEIARLQGHSFLLPKEPHWLGGWGHPWMFALLSCTRNIKNNWDQRESYADQMTIYSQGKRTTSKLSLFDLFYHILSMYTNSMNGKPINENLNEISTWCKIQKKMGFPGWYSKLMPFINSIGKKSDPYSSVVDLCDHFHYF